MKLCHNCSAQNADDAIFCHNCGSKFEQGATQPPTPPPHQSAYAHSTVRYDAPPRGGVIESVRELGSSTMFLTAAIALSVMIVFSAFSGFLTFNTVDFSDIFDSYDYYYNYNFGQLGDMMNDAVRTVGNASNLFSQIPAVLICVGMWMIYASCRRRSGEVSVGGLSMIRVVTIIKLCLFSFAIGIFAIIFLFAAIATYTAGNSGYSYFSGDMPGVLAGTVFAVALFAVAAVSVPVIFYFTKTLKTIKCVVQTIRTGTPNHGISMYLVVMNFIIAGFSFLALIASSLTYMSMSSAAYSNYSGLIGGNIALFNTTPWPGWISSIASIVCLALISVLLLQYRSRMRLEACNTDPGLPSGRQYGYDSYASPPEAQPGYRPEDYSRHGENSAPGSGADETPRE